MKIGTLSYFNNVLKELINIKKNATQEEINNLDFKVFNPRLCDRCLYGQMTENCYNPRAIELINLCTTTNTSFENIAYDYIVKEKPRKNQSHSYLEHCINRYPNNNENIIKFLIGEINSIKLTSKN